MENHQPLSTMTVRNDQPFRRVLFFLLLISTLLACTLNNLIAGDKPITIIASPPSGSVFQESDKVEIYSISTDPKGVARVELEVDGELARSDTAPTPQTRFPLTQTWQATRGFHTVVVTAFNARDEAISPAGILVQVSQVATPTLAAGTLTPSSASGTIPAAGNPSPSPSAGCTNSAAFVADVTIPDGSVLLPGAAANKTWRLVNNGTCAWGDGYQFVFVGGEAMTTIKSKPVPSTDPGARADLSVAIAAPAALGSHTGSWRMRSPEGVLFGTAVTVKITVPAPPAAAAAPAPSGPCSGTPVITSFTVDSAMVTWGGKTNLRWGPVTSADSADIDQGIGDIAAGPAGGTVEVSPSQSTIYTLNAHCGTNTVQKTVTILVPFAVTSVVGSVSPASGACTQTFTFQFTIGVNTAGTVYWRRDRSDNASDPAPGNYAFDNAGSYTVPSYTWQPTPVSGTHTYWMQLHTTSPTDVTSNQATFTVTCP